MKKNICVTSGKNEEQKNFFSQIKYIGAYLRPHRGILIISLFLSCISTTLGMLQPWFAKILIDRVLIARNADILLPILSILIGVMIISFFIRTGNNYIYTRYSARILFSMREDLFRHLQKIPMGFFARKKIGDIYSRIATDMADIQAMITDTIPHYVFDFLTCIITASILLCLNWKMALMSFAFMPFAVWVVRSLRPKLYDLSNEVAKSNADIAHFLFESLGNTALIRAFGAEKIESGKLRQKHSAILEFLLRYQILGAFSGSVPMAFGIINTLVVFGYGGLLVLDNTMTIGSLVAFSVYQGRVFGPLQGVMDGVLAIQKSKVSIKRVREILDIEPGVDDKGTVILSDRGIERDIVFNNISFAYDHEETVLKHISFSIPQGKTTLIVGPSGIGKTTICHLLLKLFQPGSGNISWGDIDINQLKTDWLRRQIALVSQDTFLFHDSIMENIRFSKPDATDEEVKKAAMSAHISEFIESLPGGFHTMIGDRGVRLSGGQKQRISIARSILLRPRILILDEATAFLDNPVERQIRETIRELMKNKTLIVVSHRSSSIGNADKIIALGKNGITYEGAATDYAEENNDGA